jgi:hypothetical protein
VAFSSTRKVAGGRTVGQRAIATEMSTVTGGTTDGTTGGLRREDSLSTEP